MPFVASPRRGTTLVELMAALGIAGLLLLTAYTLTEQVSLGATRIHELGQRTAIEGNGRRIGMALLRQAQVGIDTSDRFDGSERRATFRTLCEAAGGWSEPCAVSIVLLWTDSATWVEAEFPGDEKVQLWTAPPRAEFRYENDTQGDTSWVRRWGRSIVLPRAIAVVSLAESTIVRVGARP